MLRFKDEKNLFTVQNIKYVFMKIRLMVSMKIKRLVAFMLISLFLFHLPASPITAQGNIAHSNYVNTVEWNHAGDTLASGSTDRSIILWDDSGVATQVKSSVQGPNGSVLDLSWSQDDQWIVSGDASQNTLLWNTSEDALLPRGYYDSHSGYVKSVDTNPAIKTGLPQIVTGGDGKRVIEFTIKNGSEYDTSRQIVGFKGTIMGVKYSADGNYVGTATLNNKIELHNMTDGVLPNNTLVASVDVGEPIYGMDMNAAGDTFVVITKAHVYTYTLGNFGSSMTQVGTALNVECENCLNLGIDISPDESKIAIGSGKLVQAYTWSNDTGIGQKLFEKDAVADLGLEAGTPAAQVVDVSWNPDNNQLAFAAGAGVYNYDTSQGSQIFARVGSLPGTTNVVLIALIVFVLAVVAIFIIRRQLKKRS